MCNSMPSKTLVWKAVALAAGVGLAMLSYPVHAAPASGGDTVPASTGTCRGHGCMPS